MRFSAGALSLLLAPCWLMPGQVPTSRTSAARSNKNSPSPAPADAKPDPLVLKTLSPVEKLTFDVEWRLVHAGTVIIESQKAHADMKIESAGLVSSLYKVNDTYTVDYDEPFCAGHSLMDSQEGKRHHESKTTFDRVNNRASFLERDVLKDVVLHSDEVAIPNCVHEVIGAFLRLRAQPVEPGQSTQLPMSDGRRTAAVRVDAQGREEIKTPAGAFRTVRYEVHMLNSVIYTRRGQVFVWLSEDPLHLPVQIRLRMQFPIGTVTLQLLKEEHL
jgi:hypothetical protein